MQFLLLIYSNEQEDASRPEGEQREYHAAFGTFTKGIISSGNFVAGDALMPTETARTVRVRDGKTLTTDGPFAETKEQLGGYYLVEAENMENAISIAARIPTAKHGSIEVRPIMVVDMN